MVSVQVGGAPARHREPEGWHVLCLAELLLRQRVRELNPLVAWCITPRKPWCTVPAHRYLTSAPHRCRYKRVFAGDGYAGDIKTSSGGTRRLHQHRADRAPPRGAAP
eukprot:SAG25_NODE_3204_length_1175_cov_1.276022_1_plen_106_part_01